MPKYVFSPPEGSHAKHHVKAEGGEKRLRPCKKGEVVEMTESQYLAFKDRFKPLAVIEAEAKVAAEVAEQAKAAAAQAEADAKKPAPQGTQNPNSGSPAKS